MIVSVVQMDPTPSIEKNMQTAFRFVHQAARVHTELLVFPELFLYRGDPRAYPAIARTSEGASVSFFAALARQYTMTIVLGSIIEGRARSRLYDTSFVISGTGQIVCTYRKIHLFEVTSCSLRIREADHFCPGDRDACFAMGREKIGLAICFDLRYPALFARVRAQGVSAFCIPSNFTQTTGKAHWKALVRARAIETQSFVFAANCCGIDRFSGVSSYGHSMIVDPWGDVLAELGDTEGILTRPIAYDHARSVRARIRM